MVVLRVEVSSMVANVADTMSFFAWLLKVVCKNGARVYSLQSFDIFRPNLD